MTNHVPVVVFKLVSDPLQHGGLGVTRSLGRLGIPVYTAYRDTASPAARSRYVAGRFTVRSTDESETLHLLQRIARRLGYGAVLLPLDDVAAAFTDRNGVQLRAWFRFPCQPEGLAIRLADKGELYRMCVAAGVPVPDTRFPNSQDEFLRMAGELGYPVVVKSMDPVLLRQRPLASSVAIARNARQAQEIYDGAEVPQHPNLMLQQFIPGGATSVWMFNGYVGEDGRCRFGITGQKVRQAPPDTGATTLGIAALNSAVAEHATRFLASIGYRGIVDMGFRHDARDGSYRLLDVNPRIGSSFRLFVDAAGNDVVRAMYADLTGMGGVSTSLVTGERRWLVENQDAATVLKLMGAGRLTAADWARSLRGIEELAWWAADDRRPFAAMLLSTAADVRRRLSRSLTRRAC